MIPVTPKDLRALEETFAKLENDVTIIYFTEEVSCRHCRQERELLDELVDLSHKLHLDVYNFTADRDVADDYGIDKVPGFLLDGVCECGVRYYGMPSDFEFKMLLEDLLRISSGESGLSPESKERLGKLDTPLHLEVLTTPLCPFTEKAVRLAHQVAIESDLICADLVNVEDFPKLTEHYDILAAPTVVVNETYQFYGALDENPFLTKILDEAPESVPENAT
ncbi:MAG: thioredoxin family protein [Planctomycetes bacterium]|nr:thioredoxin family protein [Planctomycetota bacterium]